MQPEWPVSDRSFVELFDLSDPALPAARQAAEAGDFAAAADAVLGAVTAGPIRSYTAPDEAAELGRRLARDRPDLAGRLQRIADIAARGRPARRRRYLSDNDVHAEARRWSDRGRGFLILGQLAVLTGQDRWAELAADILAQLPRYPGPVDDDPEAFVPLCLWHPGCPDGFDVLGAAHSVQYLVIALPMLWPRWGRAARISAVAYMAGLADVLHRGSRDDQPFNIPLHGLTAALGTAAVLPQLRRAHAWRETMDAHLGQGGAYVSPPFAASEGYYHEGLGYQNVNQMLLTQCLLLKQRALGEPDAELATLRRLVEAGFEFAAATARPDGATFLICDCMSRASHEHELDMHEALHLGAALFDRPAFKARAGTPQDARLFSHLPFLMGLAGYERWKRMPDPDIARRPHRPAAFPEAGFLHLKAGLGAEHGCCGLLKASVEHNHAHFDCLSIDIFGLGRELIGDSGKVGSARGGENISHSQKAHAVCRMAHLAPPGPRIQGHVPVTLKRLAVSDSGRIQLAVADHRLIANHRQRRMLALLLPDGQADSAVWVVWDGINWPATADGAEPPPTGRAPAPMRFTETLFPLHAPGGPARLQPPDERDISRTGWSCHRGDDRLPDPRGQGRLEVTCRQACQAIEHGDSDGNIQMTALRPADADGDIAAVLSEGFSAHFGFACPRPVLEFRWRGRMPHEAAYVLLPFAGLAERPPFQVDGWCLDRDRPGAFEAVIRAGSRPLPAEITIRGEGLAGSPGEEIRLTLTCVGAAPETLRVTL